MSHFRGFFCITLRHIERWSLYTTFDPMIHGHCPYLHGYTLGYTNYSVSDTNHIIISSYLNYSIFISEIIMIRINIIMYTLHMYIYIYPNESHFNGTIIIPSTASSYPERLISAQVGSTKSMHLSTWSKHQRGPVSCHCWGPMNQMLHISLHIS